MKETAGVELCIPGIKGTPFEKLPKEKAWEWYFNNLREQIKQDKDKNGNGNGNGDGDKYGNSFDDHSGFGNEDGASASEIAKERMRQAMEDAVSESVDRGRGWGTVPIEMQKLILSLIKGTVNWKAALRYFIKTSIRADKYSTIKRVNKRFPYIHPGRKVNRVANIAISIDQSGSVSDEMLVKFFNELNHLSKLATFTVIPFDSHVDPSKVYVWEKDRRHAAERVLQGGTDFDAPTQYVNDKGFEGHIILTDMCAPAPKRSKCPRLWLTDEAGAKSKYFQPVNEKVLVMRD
jgi:predicted metal-dependent peptidase